MTTPQEKVKGAIPASLLVCAAVLLAGTVLGLIGYSQERTPLLQLGLVLSAFGAFCGIARIAVWGSDR